MDQVHRARYDFMLDYLRFPPLQTRVAGVSFEDRQVRLCDFSLFRSRFSL